MANATIIPLPAKSHEAFIEYYRVLQDSTNSFRSELRSRLTTIDKSYQREKDKSYDQQQAKLANELGNASKFQNITVPVVMPSIEASVTHQTSVFLSGAPLFGVVSSPQFIDEALQMETLIDNQATRGAWVRELILFFRDGLKYNFSPLEVTWEEEKLLSVQTDLSINTNQGIPKEILWAGNKIKRLDPYNTFVDHRVAPTEVYTNGEYAGYTRRMHRVQLKAFINSLPDVIIKNIKPALESGLGTTIAATADSKHYYIPSIRDDVNKDHSYQGTNINWMSWAGLTANNRSNQIEYKDSYELTVLYCRVMPVEFGLALPSAATPQVFKLIIVNHSHIIYCERQTNAHNWIPILIGQPHEDGLEYQTKSQATNVEPFQAVASSYMNSIIHSRRRAITDRLLYDPSRVSQAHINSDNPSAKIPCRPAAYGKNMAESVYQFPYREDQSQHSMLQIQQLVAFSNQLMGQNPVSHGQFVKGNKTRKEVDTVLQNSSGREQTVSLLYEYQVFMPLKHILKLNILQYQGQDEIYNRDIQKAIEIDPIKLRKAVLEFKISDGLLPSDKIMSTDEYIVALQVLGSSPQIAAGYNMAPMFSYLMKIKGAKISEFEKSPEQLAYEQALFAWQALSEKAIENGIDPEKLPSQPKPQEFGYNPQQSQIKSERNSQQVQAQTSQLQLGVANGTT